jgi:hypothetical protein
MHRENLEHRSGPLRNGNPRGNPNLAPRCGARTRAGCACRAPAMKNERCRMHGGASTGPRTEAGRARIRAARTKHGFYGAECQAALRRANAFIAETRALLAALGSGGAAAGGAAEREEPMHRETHRNVYQTVFADGDVSEWGKVYSDEPCSPP